MQTINLKTAMLKTALAAIVLLSASGAAQAQQQVNLTAAPAATTLSDGSVVPMWGYSCGAAVSGSRASCTALNSTAGASWSPVVIMVPSGQGLTINLTNNLAFSNGNKVPTSLVIAGQVGGGLGSGGTTTSSPDHSTVRTGTWPIAGATPPVSALAPQQGPRVQSFATEVVAAGVTPVLPQVASGSSLTWGSLQPGTYLIQSGTHPSIQVPMGLYGILVVTDAANGIAYPAATSGKAAAVTYNGDVPLLFSEIDPVQNTAVSNAVNAVAFSGTLVWSGQPGGCGNPAYVPSAATPACYPPAVNYTPLYYLINGRTFDTTNASVSVFPVNPLPSNTCTPVSPATTCVPTVSGNVLVRLVNAGLRMHVPSIVGATTGTTNAPGMTLVAEDGNVLPGLARIQNEVFLAAGKTHDVMINAPAASLTALPIYDRELSLSANATARDAGMLAYIGVNGAGLPAPTASGALGAAVANPDTYNALVPGMPLTISDPGKGVIANDVRVHGVQLLTPPTSGSVTLYANGTFSYFASKISVALTNGGSGYATTPVVTFTAPPSGGTLATATAAVGTSGVSSIAMGSNGAGYTAPTVTIGAPPAGGTQATATATIKSSVTVTLGTAGSGYGTPVVTIDPPPPGGTPATATATVDGTGAITTLTVTNAGAGYVAAPGVTISDSTPGSTATGATATAGIASGTGVISAINLTNPGSGYTVPPAVTIADTVPPTSGASATAILSPGAGTVTAINLTYPGSGYTLPPAVTITGGAGTGATATASIVAGSATSDSFTYCANGTVNAGVCSSGITAPVTLGASTLLATAGVTCTGTTFNSNVATYLAVGTPGVLAGCTDAAGLQVTVDTSTISATGITVLADANGGFTATSTAAGAYSFSFKAKNSLGMQSAATTVTVVFPTPSNLTVTVLDGADHVTKLDDYRWIIEEDRTFYVDPACTSNPLPAGCPTISSTVTNPINYGTNFHTSAMPLVAAGCTGPLSCESGQTMQTAVAVVCDVGNGVCRPGTQQTATLPGSVHLDTSKRYYISILPGDAANPFIGGNLSAPTNCTSP